MKNKKTLVGIWSGASPASSRDLRLGLKQLKALGLHPLWAHQTPAQATRGESKDRPFLASQDSQKIKSLQSLLKNRNITDILCVRGGYGTIRLIEALEKLSLSKNNPKRIWGFSDITSLQNYLYLQRGFSFVHSPMLTSNAFITGQKKELAAWQSQSRGSLLKFKVRHLDKSFTTKTIPKRAPILGGNLTCLASLMVLPKLKLPRKNFFLFLEDVSERAYRIDRMLTLLKMAGLLKHCRGIFLGHFTDCPGHEGVLRAFSYENRIPVFTGIPAGHARPNCAIPLGVNVDIEALDKNFGTLELRFPNPRIGCLI